MEVGYIDAIKKDYIIAVVPARAGSKGVTGKNIKLLAGHPLIAYSICASLYVDDISRVIVSTDSAKIKEISKKYGADVPFLRPESLATDTSTDFDFIQHLIEWLYNNEGVLPEYIVHMRPTTPLRDIGIIKNALRVIKNQGEATSLRSAHKASESPFKWFKKEGDYFTSFTGNINNDAINNARQSFPDAYIPDGYVDVLKTKNIIETNLLHGDKIIAFESPYCTEVDTLSDFEYLEYEISNKHFELREYLNKNY